MQLQNGRPTDTTGRLDKYLQPQDKDKGHVWPGDKGHAS